MDTTNFLRTSHSCCPQAMHGETEYECRKLGPFADKLLNWCRDLLEFGLAVVIIHKVLHAAYAHHLPH